MERTSADDLRIGLMNSLGWSPHPELAGAIAAAPAVTSAGGATSPPVPPPAPTRQPGASPRQLPLAVGTSPYAPSSFPVIPAAAHPRERASIVHAGESLNADGAAEAPFGGFADLFPPRPPRSVPPSAPPSRRPALPPSPQAAAAAAPTEEGGREAGARVGGETWWAGGRRGREAGGGRGVWSAVERREAISQYLDDFPLQVRAPGAKNHRRCLTVA